MEALTLLVFAVGALVLVLTLVGALLIGLREAADPDQAKLSDLTEFERSIVLSRERPSSFSREQPSQDPGRSSTEDRTGTT